MPITAAGKKRFTKWLEGAAGSSAHTVRLEFLTRLYFANQLMPKQSPRIYEAQAKEFTGYWAGTQDLDTALKNTTAAMTDLLK